MRFVFWLPKGKTDTRIAVVKEMKTMITFIDVGHCGGHITCVTLILKKDTFGLNFLTY